MEVVIVFPIMLLVLFLVCLVVIYEKWRNRGMTIEQFLEKVAERYPEAVSKLRYSMRGVSCGLLSVGLKLHYLQATPEVQDFFNAIGAPTAKGFALRGAMCVVFPPVGSAHAAIELLELIEEVTEVSIFRSPDVQIQICTPGRLSEPAAAILGIAYYLGSDMLKRYRSEDHHTTQPGPTGDRLVIYDHNGEFDANFEYWGLQAGNLFVREKLPFKQRTDVLTCKTHNDIKNVNLIASLLVHAENNGFWRTVGRQFAYELNQIILNHGLVDIFVTPWTRKAHTGGRIQEDDEWFAEFDKLMDYTFNEVVRLNDMRYKGADKKVWESSLLFQVQSLLRKYRAIVNHKLPVVEVS